MLLDNYNKLVLGSNTITVLKKWLNFDWSWDCASPKTFPKALSSGCQCQLLFLFSFKQLFFIYEFNSPHWTWAHYVEVIWLQAVKTSKCYVCHMYTYCWHLNATILPSKCNHTDTVKDQRENWFLWDATKLSQGRGTTIGSAVLLKKTEAILTHHSGCLPPPLGATAVSYGQ